MRLQALALLTLGASLTLGVYTTTTSREEELAHQNEQLLAMLREREGQNELLSAKLRECQGQNELLSTKRGEYDEEDKKQSKLDPNENTPLFTSIGDLKEDLDRIELYPKCIVDVGAREGQWTRELLQDFPAAQFIMFEANEQHKHEWGDLLRRQNVDAHIAILADEAKQVRWFTIGGGYGDSMFKEPTQHYADVKPSVRLAHTLDSILGRYHRECHVDMIKVDTQGAGERTVVH